MDGTDLEPAVISDNGSDNVSTMTDRELLEEMVRNQRLLLEFVNEFSQVAKQFQGMNPMQMMGSLFKR